MFETFSKLVNDRQSCRDFNDKPLEKETIDKIIELSMLAPSACNSQPWKMYVITEENMLKNVARTLQDMMMNKFTNKAKAFIVLGECNATLKLGASLKFDRNHFVKYDIGQISAYITLTAESLGVSSCIIGWVNEKELKKVLSMPEEEGCSIVIALGYSDIPKRKKMRKDKDKIVVEIK